MRISDCSSDVCSSDHNAALAYEDTIKTVAAEIAMARDVLYLGRGTDYPIALEGALQLKEISYIHAEGYADGEMKHGPIALIDEKVPVIVMAPSDRKSAVVGMSETVRGDLGDRQKLKKKKTYNKKRR